MYFLFTTSLLLLTFNSLTMAVPIAQDRDLSEELQLLERTPLPQADRGAGAFLRRSVVFEERAPNIEEGEEWDQDPVDMDASQKRKQKGGQARPDGFRGGANGWKRHPFIPPTLTLPTPSPSLSLEYRPESSTTPVSTSPATSVTSSVVTQTPQTSTMSPQKGANPNGFRGGGNGW
ncbi:hypothetical protein M231_00096 [Tremella mesenterica]|uniref:Uncharacterized protein n=1 Tax=Tremella mesenterica TaxID=5217 RepID=A0A4Q1BWQ8_TREME|nr:uncharacterized protein TREMEDRAFT_59007 [Tremella mesenterica DSM 1558]EIW72839.1 hypothetical protein TREMEDRAFT_59007 [Tremella mesenterica DSM 1558]RXK42542.1 hypothetical protein M231_00096 [Tremella mesenterica]